MAKLRLQADNAAAKAMTNDEAVEIANKRAKYVNEAFIARLALHNVPASSLNFANRVMPLRQLFCVEFQSAFEVVLSLLKKLASIDPQQVKFRLPDIGTAKSDSEFLVLLQSLVRGLGDNFEAGVQNQQRRTFNFSLVADGLLSPMEQEDVALLGLEVRKGDSGLDEFLNGGVVVDEITVGRMRLAALATHRLKSLNFELPEWLFNEREGISKNITGALGFRLANLAVSISWHNPNQALSEAHLKWAADPKNVEVAGKYSVEYGNSVLENANYYAEVMSFIIQSPEEEILIPDLVQDLYDFLGMGVVMETSVYNYGKVVQGDARPWYQLYGRQSVLLEDDALIGRTAFGTWQVSLNCDPKLSSDMFINYLNRTSLDDIILTLTVIG